MIDTAVLHAKIVATRGDFLRELFGEEVKLNGTDKWRVGRRGSLAIGVKEDRLVFYSHEEGKGGDAVALWQRERGGTVGEVLKAMAAWAGVPDSPAPKNRRVLRKAEAMQRRVMQALQAQQQVRPVARPLNEVLAEQPRMTEEQFEEGFAMVRRLAYDDALCERIAKQRGWRVETVRELTGTGALGWSDGWPGMHTGAIAFCYNSGIKHRWTRGSERVVRWYRGGPTTLWRSWLIVDQKELWITEGETDAITMINGGIESSREVLVLALPNAGVAPYGLAEFAAGRKVTLSLDADKAGRAATEKIKAIVRPVAASLKIWRTP